MNKIVRTIPVLLITATLLAAADDGGSKTASTPSEPGSSAGSVKGYVPPVMRSGDPGDTILVVLPGPAPAPVAPPPVETAPVPVAPVDSAKATTPESPDGATASPANPGVTDGPRPYFRRAAKIYPDGFQADTLRFLQDRIGKWTADDVIELLGPSTRQRPAFGEDQKENGSILAFVDPTNRFKEFELDFDSNTGALRTVFAYPIQMTWLECRKQFGAKVTATDASKGRKFYSYGDRRLDVLVGPDGRVVSLGLY